MSELRIDSHRLNQVAELIILWRTRGYKFRDELEKLIGFKFADPSSDYVTQLRTYLILSNDSPRPRPTTDPNDPLPDHLAADNSLGLPMPKGAAVPPTPPPVKEFGQPDLPPLDMTDPLSIWRYTRRNLLYTYVIADYILKSGWDYIDRRPVSTPLTKDAGEVENILREQLIEERFLKDCNPKFVGMLELIYKAFDDWHKTQHNQPKRFGEL
jgi:hypothetical protein